MRSHAQPGRSPACKKAAVLFFDRGYKLLLLPAGSMTTTSFFCRKKALWPFPPITLPRPEPFVNPAPQILQLLCRAARLCATVPTSAVVFRQIPPLFRSPKPSMIMVQRGSGQRRPGSQSRRRRPPRPLAAGLYRPACQGRGGGADTAEEMKPRLRTTSQSGLRPPAPLVGEPLAKR